MIKNFKKIVGITVVVATIGGSLTACHLLGYDKDSLAMFDPDVAELLYYSDILVGRRYNEALSARKSGVNDVGATHSMMKGRVAEYYGIEEWRTPWLKDIGTTGNINVEGFKSLKPDVIFVGNESEAGMEEVKKLAPKAKIVDTKHQLEGMFEAIKFKYQKMWDVLYWRREIIEKTISVVDSWSFKLYLAFKDSLPSSKRVMFVREKNGVYERYGATGRYSHLYKELDLIDPQVGTQYECTGSVTKGCPITEEMWRAVNPGLVIYANNNMDANMKVTDAFEVTDAYINKKTMKLPEAMLYADKSSPYAYHSIVGGLIDLLDGKYKI